MANPEDSQEGSAPRPRHRRAARPKPPGQYRPEPERYGGDEPSLEGEHDTDPAEVHRDYLERHLGGGAPATPEAYARALEQWHQLSGAVHTPPTEMPVAPPPPSPDEPGSAPADDAAGGEVAP